MKKQILIFILFFLFSFLSAEISINKYGRIKTSQPKIATEYYIENAEYYIDVNELTLIGNALFEIENGFLTLTGEHENIPTTVRIYNNAGNTQFTKKFIKVINLRISQNGKFTIFLDGKNSQVLNNSSFKLKEFLHSINFDINNNGEPILVDDDQNIVFKSHTYSINATIRKVLFQNNIPLIISENSIFKIEKKLTKLYTFESEIFDAKLIDNKLYIVIKNNSNYKLFKFNNSKNIEEFDEIIFERSSNKMHEPIYAPLNYGEEDYPFPIGNSYAEIQQYGYTPYLHPGVDYLGEDYQEVYAVHDGFVKAILTTGGDPYWRIAIANEDVSTETEGYLYAHLNQNSFTVNVGDEVESGDILGTLFPWNYYDFTHIHFARVFCTGEQWYGDWWTTENNLFDVINIQDTIPPIFENAIDDQKFAFVDADGTYLDPFDLSGEFDIIAKCHDIANSSWRIDIHDLSYSLHPISEPDSTVFQKFAYVYDFDLDTYINSTVDYMILTTVYSRDATCYSNGNYQDREYYHIITNSNGDSLITEDDAAEIFDSSQFIDGEYFFKVTARDASLNTTIDSMLVSFNNGVNADNDLVQSINYDLRNSPNPFNPTTTISFSIQNGSNVELSIYNTKGQKVNTLTENEFSKGDHSVIWNGVDENNKLVSSGIYYYKLKVNSKTESVKKCLLLK